MIDITKREKKLIANSLEAAIELTDDYALVIAELVKQNLYDGCYGITAGAEKRVVLTVVAALEQAIEGAALCDELRKGLSEMNS